jgi:hypothetical protein
VHRICQGAVGRTHTFPKNLEERQQIEAVSVEKPVKTWGKAAQAGEKDH